MACVRAYRLGWCFFFFLWIHLFPREIQISKIWLLSEGMRSKRELVSWNGQVSMTARPQSGVDLGTSSYSTLYQDCYRSTSSSSANRRSEGILFHPEWISLFIMIERGEICMWYFEFFGFFVQQLCISDVLVVLLVYICTLNSVLFHCLRS